MITKSGGAFCDLDISEMDKGKLSAPTGLSDERSQFILCANLILLPRLLKDIIFLVLTLTILTQLIDDKVSLIQWFN